jgi:predicted phosphodiesterase
MRLAVIADIHGNVLALRAVLADIARRGVDRIVNLGDCVSGPLWPRETLELLQQENIPSVRGNHDRWVAETPRAEMYPSDAYAFDQLSPDQRAALGGLPPRLDLEDGITAVHATPDDDNRYLLEDVAGGRLVLSPAAAIAERLGGLRPALLLCGHSHQPRIVHGPDGMLIVNPGSVGAPAYADPTPPAPHVSEAGSPHARYALLTRTVGVWSVDMIAIAYDWDAAARRAAGNARPEWSRALATGFMP